MIHDPSPKFAGAGTLPLFSEARSNLRHNQHAPGPHLASHPGPGQVPVRAGPALSQCQRAGSSRNICRVSQVRFMTRARADEKVHHDCQMLGWARRKPVKGLGKSVPVHLVILRNADRADCAKFIT